MAYQEATGILAFDVPELFKPMVQCISEIQERFDEEKSAMMKDLNQDPMPHFTQKQIDDTTQFLSAALDAMQSVIDNFTPEALKLMSEETLRMQLEKSRESARHLAILFGDRSTTFDARSMKGKLVEFQASPQSCEIRERLQSLQSFLATFGQSKWLGQVFATEEFQKSQAVVLALLKGLLTPLEPELPETKAPCQLLVSGMTEHACILNQQYEPSNFINGKQAWLGQKDKYCLFWIPSYKGSGGAPLGKPMWLIDTSTHSNKACGYCYCEGDDPAGHAWKVTRYGGANAPTVTKISSPQAHNHVNSPDSAAAPYVSHRKPSSKHIDVPNPLATIQAMRQTEGEGCIEKLQCLGMMCEELARIFKDQEKNKANVKQQMEMKMASLKSFVMTLNRVPEVLNRYLLVRLGEIDVEGATVLKQWITHDEATQVHKMLEAFRDEAIYERAIRDFASRGSISSWKLAGSDRIESAKDYLFASSVGQSSQAAFSNEQDDAGEQQVDIEPHDESTASAQHETKRKVSHRQRKRQAKFWASVPRTPSSATHQS
mmetsp:Transcript_148861/g.274929  ORF Transcript_148861/g.274929 Transcript_148861/m.274929 type:complete len:545 (+) Transcript_148861:26-1660(+)